MTVLFMRPFYALLVIALLVIAVATPVFGEQDNTQNQTEAKAEKESVSADDEPGEEEKKKRKSFWERQKEKDACEEKETKRR